MSELGFALMILAETAVSLFIIWGYMHEDRFVRFEQRSWKKIKRFFRKCLRYVRAFFIALLFSEKELNKMYNERFN